MIEQNPTQKLNFISNLMVNPFKIEKYEILDIDKLYNLFTNIKFYESNQQRELFIKYISLKHIKGKYTMDIVANDFDNTLTLSQVQHKFEQIKNKIYNYFYAQVKDPNRVNITDSIYNYFKSIGSNLSKLFDYELQQIKNKEPLYDLPPAADDKPILDEDGKELDSFIASYNKEDGRILLQKFNEGFFDYELDLTDNIMEFAIEKLFNDLNCPANGGQVILTRTRDKRDNLIKVFSEVK